MKKFYVVIFLALLAACFSTADGEETGPYFVKVNGGGSLPSLPRMSDELSLQGDENISLGYNFCVSFGRTFLEKSYAMEVYFTVSRYPEFSFQNEAKEFEGNITHYNYALVIKKCFRSDAEKLFPYAGIGLGYGRTSIAAAGGRIDGLEGLALLQLEYRVADNIGLLAEGVYTTSFKEDRYSSPFLEASNEDYIPDSNGEPLNDIFSSVEFRFGVKIWLRPPKRF